MMIAEIFILNDVNVECLSSVEVDCLPKIVRISAFKRRSGKMDAEKEVQKV